MRIEGPNRIGQGAYGQRRAASGSGFSLPESGSQAPAQKPAGMVHAPALDALLALQSVDVVSERRQKAMSRGRRLLDLLDTLKLGLLDGALSPGAVENLRTAVADARQPTDDPVLEGILDEIELRALVELAKLGRAAD
jgi:hypothetical protein